MYPRKMGKRKGPMHHRGRKSYHIPVKREVHDKLTTVARVMRMSPGAVIERLLSQ